VPTSCFITFTGWRSWWWIILLYILKLALLREVLVVRSLLTLWLGHGTTEGTAVFFSKHLAACGFSPPQRKSSDLKCSEHTFVIHSQALFCMLMYLEKNEKRPSHYQVAFVPLTDQMRYGTREHSNIDPSKTNHEKSWYLIFHLIVFSKIFHITLTLFRCHLRVTCFKKPVSLHLTKKMTLCTYSYICNNTIHIHN